MDFNKLYQSKTFKVVLAAVGALIVLLLVFRVGVFVGYKKAGFSYSWGENYQRNFAGPRGGFLQDVRRGFGDADFINAHGTFGAIIKIDPSATTGQVALIIKGDNDVEKTILVSDKTEVMSGREAIKASNLKIDNRVVVIGSPNENGQIEAKLIRLFRPLP